MKRNKFSLSHYKLLTCDMGQLIPVGAVEVLPGDTFQHATSLLLRVSPLLAPVMHPVQVRIHHWFVPYRLVWDNWEKFITGGPDGMDASEYPYIASAANKPAIGSLGDYFGNAIKVGGSGFTNASALPYRAYALIYNEWYRDQDLTPPVTMLKTDGRDPDVDDVEIPFTNRVVLPISWEKDYFTSARPWTQKGPDVTLPLGIQAPVLGLGIQDTAGSPQTNLAVHETGNHAATYAYGRPTANSPGGVIRTAGDNNIPDVYADLSDATSVTINAVREAFALQRYEEARARYGSRYTEYLRYLGVRSSDSRLQRPEYLGGGRQVIQFSEVLQTAPGSSSVVGDLKGHGISAVRSRRYRRFFEEHGIVMSLLSVRPRTMYHQGQPRKWNRRIKEDFWQKELEHIGQQEIKNKEIFAYTAEDENTFGYQDRYDEYRREESGVCGEFHSLLNYWHMGRDFAELPTLNSDFVKCTPTKRIHAVQTNHVLWIMCHHSIRARRMVAREGTSRTF